MANGFADEDRETETDTETEAHTDAEAHTDTDGHAEPKKQADKNADAEADAETETEAETETDASEAQSRTTALTSLDLAGCTNVTSDGVCAVVSLCPQLTTLNIRGVRLVDDKGEHRCLSLSLCACRSVSACVWLCHSFCV